MRSKILITSFLTVLFFSACSKKEGAKEEQIALKDTTNIQVDTTITNAVQGNLSLNQISTAPRSVVLTGMNEHRLVTIYKSKPEQKSESGYGSSFSKRNYYEYEPRDFEEHFMPGLDLIYGYNLLNIAHYDLTNEKLNFLFDHPVLVKSLYYPSFIQDSLYKKPINRNYFLVSVYDTDTNGDTLINKKDLRRFYFFNASAADRVQLIPDEYSVERSEYDPKNDVMYVFARHDSNHNGKSEKKEPLHIFWFNLKQPAKAKRLY